MSTSQESIGQELVNIFPKMAESEVEFTAEDLFIAGYKTEQVYQICKKVSAECRFLPTYRDFKKHIRSQYSNNGNILDFFGVIAPSPQFYDQLVRLYQRAKWKDICDRLLDNDWGGQHAMAMKLIEDFSGMEKWKQNNKLKYGKAKPCDQHATQVVKNFYL